MYAKTSWTICCEYVTQPTKVQTTLDEKIKFSPLFIPIPSVSGTIVRWTYVIHYNYSSGQITKRFSIYGYQQVMIAFMGLHAELCTFPIGYLWCARQLRVPCKIHFIWRNLLSRPYGAKMRNPHNPSFKNYIMKRPQDFDKSSCNKLLVQLLSFQS